MDTGEISPVVKTIVGIVLTLVVIGVIVGIVTMGTKKINETATGIFNTADELTMKEFTDYGETDHSGLDVKNFIEKCYTNSLTDQDYQLIIKVKTNNGSATYDFTDTSDTARTAVKSDMKLMNKKSDAAYINDSILLGGEIVYAADGKTITEIDFEQ